LTLLLLAALLEALAGRSLLHGCALFPWCCKYTFMNFRVVVRICCDVRLAD
jgi:hypothetical protein